MRLRTKEQYWYHTPKESFLLSTDTKNNKLTLFGNYVPKRVGTPYLSDFFSKAE